MKIPHQNEMGEGSLKRGFFILNLCVWAVLAPSADAEDVSITTNYPSPTGIYQGVSVSEALGIGVDDPQFPVHLAFPSGPTVYLENTQGSVAQGAVRFGTPADTSQWSLHAASPAQAGYDKEFRLEYDSSPFLTFRRPTGLTATRVDAGWTGASTGKLNIENNLSGTAPVVVVEGSVAQTGKLFKLQSSTGTDLSVFDAEGDLGIETGAPRSNTIVDLGSSPRGLLLPRVADLTAVTSPAEGLLVFNTTTHHMHLYNGTKWLEFASTGQSGLAKRVKLWEAESTIFASYVSGWKDVVGMSVSSVDVQEGDLLRFTFTGRYETFWDSLSPPGSGAACSGVTSPYYLRIVHIAGGSTAIVHGPPAMLDSPNVYRNNVGNCFGAGFTSGYSYSFVLHVTSAATSATETYEILPGTYSFKLQCYNGGGRVRFGNASGTAPYKLFVERVR